MMDLLLKNCCVVDGTGANSWRGDVGVHNGRIIVLGKCDEPARRIIDASDLVVAPGFIDVHTHYDAQAFWDPTLSPSPLHGVTTVFGGNCGFSIAPLTADSADYVMRMLSRVEGMPVESLQAGVPWDWETTGDFMHRLERRLTPNSGWLIGHSALRCSVMGKEAMGPATADQLLAMQRLLRQGLEAGAMGFSSSWSASHTDHRGSPVPSRHSNLSELAALCATVGQVAGTTLEFTPSTGRFGEAEFEALAVMSVSANRPVNWNALLPEVHDDEFISHQLSAHDRAAKKGGRVVALSAPDSRHHLINMATGYLFDALPGWTEVMSLPVAEKIAYLRNPELNAKLDRDAQNAHGFFKTIADWAGFIVVETFSDETHRFVGRTIGEIAQELSLSPWQAFLHIVLSDELKTVLTQRDIGQDDRTWRRRVALWRDSRIVVGASDAGAHLDMTDAFCYTTTLLGVAVRERELLSMEEAIALLTSRPAALYGLHDRGVIRLGAWADLVVFDPARIAPDPVKTRFDLPASAGRLYAGAQGIEHVFINGVEAVRNSQFTDARPGRVLCSGRDTYTVRAQ